MKKLGIRNYTLISMAVKSIGSYNPDEILCYFEEELYVNETHEIIEFLKWVHKTENYFNIKNYETIFKLFKKIL